MKTWGPAGPSIFFWKSSTEPTSHLHSLKLTTDFSYFLEKSLSKKIPEDP